MLAGWMPLSGALWNVIGGIVIRPTIAKETACTCFDLDGEDLCFSKGVIGALTNEQEIKYCPIKVHRESEKLSRRVNKFRAAVKKCRTRGIREYLACMRSSLRR